MDPFEVPTLNIKQKPSKNKNKFSSRIDQLSVGAIRYSFLQLRSCEELDVKYILWTGMSAGEFALEYLLMSSTMQKKTKKLLKQN